MIKTSYGWALSPAYDLLNVKIVNSKDAGELALTIAGKKKKITLQNFLDFGVSLELSKKQIDSVLKRFKDLQKEALSLIENSFLSDEMQSNYKIVLNLRFETFTRAN
jgi:serine/threonine-protein kinase HipA